MNSKPSYYAILPASVRYDQNLSSSEKLFFAELTALAEKEGFCWASNKYFAELYNVSRSTVSGWVASLREKGHITVKIEKKGNEIIGRRIYIIKPSGVVKENNQKPANSSSKNLSDDGGQNNEHPPSVSSHRGGQNTEYPWSENTHRGGQNTGIGVVGKPERGGQKTGIGVVRKPEEGWSEKPKGGGRKTRKRVLYIIILQVLLLEGAFLKRQNR